jgi:hypothetical protein
MPLTDHIDDNLNVIASLKKGDKLGYAESGRLRKDGPGSAIKRTAKDSITNEERFLDPIKSLFTEAMRSSARARLARHALEGLRALKQTYSTDKAPKAMAAKRLLQEVLDIVGRNEFAAAVGCQSAIQSRACPGPFLPPNVEPHSLFDTRCRGCRGPADGLHTDDRVRGWNLAVREAQAQVTSAVGSIPADKVWKAGLTLGKHWGRFAEAFLIDVFEEACSSKPPGRFALLVNGSLARNQATPFSDLEFFFTVEEADDVAPFARIATEMWKLVKRVNKRTGSFDEDLIFCEESALNVLTTTASCLAWDGEGHLRYDLGVLAKYTSQDLSNVADDQPRFEQIMSGRCIAGDPNLFQSLRFRLMTHRYGGEVRVVVHDFREILNDWLIGDVIRNMRKDVIAGKNEFNLKGIARILMWVPIFLGRYYGIPGRGDVAHLKLLYSQNKFSDIVYQKMARALSYLTTYRYQSHMKAKGEHDKVLFTAELEECLHTFSAVVGISDVWTLKKLGKTTKGKPLECFKTLRPQEYEILDVKELLSHAWTVAPSDPISSGRKDRSGDPLRAARKT